MDRVDERLCACLSSPRRNSSTQHKLLSKTARNEAKINEALGVAQARFALLKLLPRFADELSYLISELCSFTKVECLHLSSSKIRCEGSVDVFLGPSSCFALKYNNFNLYFSTGILYCRRVRLRHISLQG